MIKVNLVLTALALSAAAPVLAQNVTPPVTWEGLKSLPVPVTAGDVSGRPYRELGTVLAGVRKATVFSNDPSEAKVYRELWERGSKMGADAVIRAEYGQARVRAMSWGSREARGVAIKFLTDAEIAALPKPAPVQP
jgi:hypothetical protein